MFGLVPKLPEITAYVNRVGSRPAAARVQAKDAELAAAQEPEA
jgi:glutathione S-transferase